MAGFEDMNLFQLFGLLDRVTRQGYQNFTGSNEPSVPAKAENKPQGEAPPQKKQISDRLPRDPNAPESKSYGPGDQYPPPKPQALTLGQMAVGRDEDVSKEAPSETPAPAGCS